MSNIALKCHINHAPGYLKTFNYISCFVSRYDSQSIDAVQSNFSWMGWLLDGKEATRCVREQPLNLHGVAIRLGQGRQRQWSPAGAAMGVINVGTLESRLLSNSTRNRPGVYAAAADDAFRYPARVRTVSTLSTGCLRCLRQVV